MVTHDEYTISADAIKSLTLDKIKDLTTEDLAPFGLKRYRSANLRFYYVSTTESRNASIGIRFTPSGKVVAVGFRYGTDTSEQEAVVQRLSALARVLNGREPKPVTTLPPIIVGAS